MEQPAKKQRDEFQTLKDDKALSVYKGVSLSFSTWRPMTKKSKINSAVLNLNTILYQSLGLNS